MKTFSWLNIITTNLLVCTTQIDLDNEHCSKAVHSSFSARKIVRVWQTWKTWTATWNDPSFRICAIADKPHFAETESYTQEKKRLVTENLLKIFVHCTHDQIKLPRNLSRKTWLCVHCTHAVHVLNGRTKFAEHKYGSLHSRLYGASNMSHACINCAVSNFYHEIQSNIALSLSLSLWFHYTTAHV